MDHPLEECLRQLEPAIKADYASRFTIAETAAISSAISLRRIADALCNPANKYGESICEAVATAMREER